MSDTFSPQENKENITPLNNYLDWLKEISWGKFVLFFILTCMISNVIESMLNLYCENLLSDLTVLFLLVSLGIKALSPIKKKSQISLTKIE